MARLIEMVMARQAANCQDGVRAQTSGLILTFAFKADDHTQGCRQLRAG